MRVNLVCSHFTDRITRDNQGKRYRQRIAHKFKYYTDKFDEILCTDAEDVRDVRLELTSQPLQVKL